MKSEVSFKAVDSFLKRNMIPKKYLGLLSDDAQTFYATLKSLADTKELGPNPHDTQLSSYLKKCLLEVVEHKSMEILRAYTMGGSVSQEVIRYIQSLRGGPWKLTNLNQVLDHKLAEQSTLAGFKFFAEFVVIPKMTPSTLEIVTEGVKVLEDNQTAQRFKARFSDVTSNDDLKVLKLVCLRVLMEYNHKAVVDYQKAVQPFMEVFESPQSQWSQSIFELLVKCDLPLVNDRIKSILEYKITPEDKPSIVIDKSIINPELLTRHNIVLLVNEMVRKQPQVRILFNKDAWIETQETVYLKFPYECYSNKDNTSFCLQEDNQADIISIARLTINSILQNKLMVDPFSQLTISDKANMLSLCFKLISATNDLEDRVETTLYQVSESDIVADGFKAVIHVLNGKPSEQESQCIGHLFSELLNVFSIHFHQEVSLSKITETSLIEDISQIFTEYQISPHLVKRWITRIYNSNFKQILKASNKSQAFQTPKLLQFCIQSFITSQQPALLQMIVHMIQQAPLLELLTTTIIVKRSKEIVGMDKAVLKSSDDLLEVVNTIKRLLELFTINSVKLTPESSNLILQLLRTNYYLVGMPIHIANKRKFLRTKGIQVREQELMDSLKVVTELLESSAIRTVGHEGLLATVGDPIHEKLLENLFNIVAILMVKPKHSTKVIGNNLSQLMNLYQKLIALRYDHIKTLKAMVKTLEQPPEGYITNLSFLNKTFQTCLFDSIGDLVYLYALFLSSSLRPSSNTPNEATLVPLFQPYVRGLSGIVDTIFKSEDKDEIGFYIKMFVQALKEEKVIMSVQYYYHLYTYYKAQLFPLFNRLFSKTKEATKISTAEPKYQAISVISAPIDNQSSQGWFSTRVRELLGTFFLREIQTVPWMSDNPVQVKPNNTQNLALGLFADQFRLMVSNISIDSLPQYEHLLRKILTPGIEIVLIQEATNNKPKRGNVSRGQGQVAWELSAMGYGRPVIEMVLGHLQDPNIHTAMEWINTNYEDVEELQSQLALQRQQISSRHKSEPIKEVQGIKEVQPQKYSEQIKPALKDLAKELLVPNLYSKYHSIVARLIIACIQKYQKQEFRVNSYLNLILKSVKQLHVQVQQRSDVKFSPERVMIQLNIVSLIVKKCVARSPIKEKIISQHLMEDLATLLEHLSSQPQLQLHGEQILASIVTIVWDMVPSKSSVNISLEIDSILDHLITVKSKKWIPDNPKEFWCLLLSRLNYSMEEARAQKVLDLFLEDLDSPNVGDFGLEYLHVLETLLSSDNKFVAANIESQIKNYFFDCDPSHKNVSKPKREFLAFFDRYNTNATFYQISKKLLKKKQEKLHNNRKATYLIYTKQKTPYSYSLVLDQEFIKFSPSRLQTTVLRKLCQSVLQGKQVNSLKLTFLHRVLQRFPLLRHHCLYQTLGDSTALDLIVRSIPNAGSAVTPILTLLCLRGGVIVQQGDKMFSHSTYVQHSIIKTLFGVIGVPDADLRRECLSLCNLLQLKEFNALSNLPLRPSQPSLRQLLESKFTPDNQFMHEPLTLIYKETVVNAIKSLYNLEVQEPLSEFQSQLVLVPLMYANTESPRREAFDRVQQMDQISIEDMDHPMMLIARLRQLQGRADRFQDILRQMDNGADSGIELVPIQFKADRKPSQVPQQVKEPQIQQPAQKQVQKQKCIEGWFQQIPITECTNQNTQVKAEEPKKAQYAKFLLPAEVTVPLSQYKISYRTKFNEPLFKRLSCLWKILEPVVESPVVESIKQAAQSSIQGNRIWSTHQEDDSPHDLRQRVTRINLRDPVGQQVFHRIMTHMPDTTRLDPGFLFRRLRNNVDAGFANRRNRESQQQSQQQQQQTLNEAQIENVLEDFVQEKKAQEVPKVTLEKVEEKNQEKKVEILVEQKVEKPKAQEPKVEEKVQQPQIQPGPAQVLEKQQEKKQEQQVVQPVAVQPTITQPVLIQGQDPPVFRQILEVFGLPQSFLRDNGLQQAQFDALPETFQMEHILATLSELQNNPSAQPVFAPDTNSLANNEADPLVNIPAELRLEARNNLANQMNDNMMLVACLDDDPEMRQQVLLQASPEFLASLPLHLQQEANNLRDRRIREIIVEEEEREQPRERRRGRKRKQRVSVHPDIDRELFKKSDDKFLLLTVKTLFYKFDKPKSLLLQSVLQNKANQQTIINTLIHLLRHPLTTQGFPTEVRLFDGEWKTLPKGQQVIRNDILSLLQNVISNCLYKDPTFLKQRSQYTGLCGIKLQPKEDLFVEGLVTQQFHHPYVQLLTYSLGSNLLLSAYLLEKLNSFEVPTVILQKIIDTFKNDKLPQEYVNSLRKVDANPKLKEMFAQSFDSKSHPKIPLLAQILKYQFSRVDYLKELHLKTLNSYKPEYVKFLSEIYRIYTLEELKNVKGLQNFKSVHKQVIRHLLALRENIFEEPISLILKTPFLLDFETKREIFYQKVEVWNNEGGHVGKLELRIDRTNMFAGSYSQIMPKTKQEMRGKINIAFQEEGAYDAGGPAREWFLLISRQMFNPQYALFQFSSSGNTYHPSAKSHINKDYLRYFKFIGRIVGKALTQRCYIDAYFTRSFYKLILGHDLDLSDMEGSDFNFYKSMLWLKQNKIEDDFYRFAYVTESFGENQTHNLIPDGQNVIVTEANKNEFIEKYCMAKMKTEIEEQIKAFLEGFHELIPVESIQYFTSEELEILMSGLPTIDLEDLKRNTEYQGFVSTDKQIVWFWEILETFDQEYLTKLVQFITGTSKIPPEGFKGLRGMHGNQKIAIHKDFAIDQLPKSHTCFNQLDLPEYPTKEIMQTKLKIALKWGSESFGFM